MAKNAEAKHLDEAMARVEAKARAGIQERAAAIVKLLESARRGQMQVDCVEAALVKAQEIVELAR